MSASTTDSVIRKRYLKHMIEKKLDYNEPVHGKLGSVILAETDFDNFPYNRYYRSIYNDPNPHVYDRPTGYKVLTNSIYECPKGAPDTYVPDNCFSASGTTVYPCYPPYFYQYAETDARNVALNRKVINTSL